MVELSSRMVMPFPFDLLMIILFALVICCVVITIGMLIGDNITGATVMFWISIGLVALAFIFNIASPRETKEIHCIFMGTVDMTEIQSKYNFISCDNDGVFTLQEKKKDDNK